MIVAEAGKHFDPDVVAAFLSAESDFLAISDRYERASDMPVETAELVAG